MVTAPAVATPIDVRSRRWLVAVHEAGHVAACRSFDWRVHRVAIIGDGGGTWDDAPWLRERRRALRESIQVSLAGPLSDERLLAVTLPADGRYDQMRTAAKDLLKAGIPDGCESDMTRAHREAVKLGVPLPELLVETRKLVAARWPEIERVARVLYERTSLDAGEIRTAAKAR